jgi:hypothetical protein
MQADALYAYAVLDAAATRPEAVLPILPGADFEVLRAGGCAALVSPVPRAVFQDGSQGRGGDPAWIAERAAAHHAVVVACAAAGPTLPLAFGALFSAEAPLLDWLAARGDALAAGLGHVQGCAEWSVRVEEDREAHAAWLDAHDPDLRTLSQRIAAAPPGLAYLLERRRDKLRSTVRGARQDELAQRLAAAMAKHARALPAALTALVANPLHAALLADIERIGAEFDGSGLGPHLAGPWPAYAAAREALAHG